jgi:hypothetical protein
MLSFLINSNNSLKNKIPRPSSSYSSKKNQHLED